MKPEFTAHIALGESLTPVGQLRCTQNGPRQFSTFAYDPAWIETPMPLPCSQISALRKDRSIRRDSPEPCVMRWPASSLMLRRRHGAAGNMLFAERLAAAEARPTGPSRMTDRLAASIAERARRVRRQVRLEPSGDGGSEADLGIVSIT